MEAGDRGRAALAYGRAPGHRDGRGRPRAQPHAGAGTPNLRPHRLTLDWAGGIAPAPLIRATSVDAPFRARGNFGETSGLSWRVVGCCHLSGLWCGSEPPRACMGVRGPGPNHSRVLEVRWCTLVIPIPSRRPLRHAFLPLAPRPRGAGAFTRPAPEPDKRPP